MFERDRTNPSPEIYPLTEEASLHKSFKELTDNYEMSCRPSQAWVQECFERFDAFDKRFPTIKEKRYVVAHAKEVFIPLRETIADVGREVAELTGNWR